MELNDFEKYALSVFQTLTNNNICKESLIDYIIETEEDFGKENINWLKVAIQLDNMRLVDAVLSYKQIKREQINEAIAFGSELTIPSLLSNKKEYVITLNLPEKKFQNPCLNTLDYVRERERYLTP